MQQSDVKSVTQALYDIVEKKLDERIKAFSPALTAQLKQILQEVLVACGGETDTSALDNAKGGDDDLASPGSPTSGGIAAFAAARRRASDGSSAPTSPAKASMSSRATKTRKSGELMALDIPAQAYLLEVDAVSEGYSPISKAPMSPAASTVNKMWGTTNLSSPGGPAGLGSGPQEEGLRRQVWPTKTYAGMYEKVVSTSGSSPKSPGADSGCKNSGARPLKELSLHQLRDIMSAVYESKAQHDKKCQEKGEPIQTMEQHLYAYLGKRYSVKSVVQDWTTFIFRSIIKNAPQDTNVAVFGKILQNTLAESFNTVVAPSCAQAVTKSIKSQLEEKYPHSPADEIAALWRARECCGVPLTECAEAVGYMYNDSDSRLLMKRFGNAAKNPSVIATPEEKLCDDCVRLRDMHSLIMAFQMGVTDAFLSEFIEIFRQVDTDCDGVLNSSELVKLVYEVGTVDGIIDDGAVGCVLQEATATALAAVRRLGPCATFSQCVDVLTGLISARWGAERLESKNEGNKNPVRALSQEAVRRGVAVRGAAIKLPCQDP